MTASDTVGHQAAPARQVSAAAAAPMADPAAWAVTASATTLVHAGHVPDITKTGGWVILAFAVLAWYHAAGDVIAATFGRKILPVGPPPVK